MCCQHSALFGGNREKMDCISAFVCAPGLSCSRGSSWRHQGRECTCDVVELDISFGLCALQAYIPSRRQSSRFFVLLRYLGAEDMLHRSRTVSGCQPAEGRCSSHRRNGYLQSWLCYCRALLGRDSSVHAIAALQVPVRRIRPHPIPSQD